MAISKERKREVVAEYAEWIERSRAIVVAEYVGLSMKDLDDLRKKIREVGGEFHIVKNTLGVRALEASGMPLQEEQFTGSTAIGFAFEDAPATAKVLVDFAKTNEFLKVKSGYLGKKMVSADEIKALAELPPLPVVRAQLMGTLLAPANQLARILAEPGRQVAALFKAFAEKGTAPEAA